VTLFGLIFTPVFYVVTRWSGARARVRTPIVRATPAE
jgi:hypothetical protein